MTNRLPIWDGARVCHDASHVANDQHDRRTIEADYLGPSPTDVFSALEHRNAMVKHVDEPQSSNLGADEEHRHELGRLGEARCLWIGYFVHNVKAA